MDLRLPDRPAEPLSFPSWRALSVCSKSNCIYESERARMIHRRHLPGKVTRNGTVIGFLLSSSRLGSCSTIVSDKEAQKEPLVLL